MKTTCIRAALALAVASLIGCSGSDGSQVSESPTAETLAAASNNPNATSMAGSAGGIRASATGATNSVEPFRNPFAPPKNPPPPPIIEEPEPEPVEPEPVIEIRQPGEPPRIRLLGFMDRGEPKVLVSYRSEVETLAVGESLEEMEVLKIDSPDLTMLFEEREIKYTLFDQAWRHEGGSPPAGKGSRVQTRPRSTRPIRNTNTSSSGGSAEREPTRNLGGLPGFAPNAGQPPGFRPPVSSGSGSTPRVSIGTPPPNLPGFGSEPSSAGIGNGGVPTFPGLEVDGNRNPGAGNVPALPLGL